jgi:hypothetical protein
MIDNQFKNRQKIKIVISPRKISDDQQARKKMFNIISNKEK